MRRRAEMGSALPLLLVLLLVLVGGGAWNYHQNLEVEAAEYRPFLGYAEEDIEALLGAYQSKQARDTESYEEASSRRASAADRAYFDEQVREFERVQRAADRKKGLQVSLAESATTLKLLQKERGRRAEESDRLRLFLKRLLTIRS